MQVMLTFKYLIIFITFKNIYNLNEKGEKKIPKFENEKLRLLKKLAKITRLIMYYDLTEGELRQAHLRRQEIKEKLNSDTINKPIVVSGDMNVKN
jgi:hypothetical protein